jgi:hypothetical protein
MKNFDELLDAIEYPEQSLIVSGLFGQFVMELSDDEYVGFTNKDIFILGYITGSLPFYYVTKGQSRTDDDDTTINAFEDAMTKYDLWKEMEACIQHSKSKLNNI